MYWNSSERWQHRRHRGNGWVFALVFVGLVLLTHGWILFLPLMALAAFAFFGLVLPKLAWHMNNGDWNREGWNRGNWHSRDWGNQNWSCMSEKRKHHFEQRWNDMRDGDDKPKRDRRDDIEYV